jgi:pimeloyl-ACP methyl ester carboxylesterase
MPAPDRPAWPRLLIIMGLAALLGGCAMGRRYRDLPQTPHRPHDFYELPRRFVSLDVPGHPRPVVLSWVEKGEGRPLLLVHGLMTDAYSFRYVISRLSEHYRVLAVDLPGAGRSDADPELPATPPQVAAVLDAFLGSQGIDRAYVVGNSLGGYLSLWLAVLYPRRVERLVVMHAPGFPEARLYALKGALRVPGTGALLRLLTRRPEQFVVDRQHYADDSIKSKEEARQYGAIFRDPARREVFRRVLGESTDPTWMKALHQRLEAWRAPGANPPPVLLLWARKDVMVSPEFGPRYQALIPHASLQWVDHASHFMHVDAPERTLEALLRFGEKGDAGR